MGATPASLESEIFDAATSLPASSQKYLTAYLQGRRGRFQLMSSPLMFCLTTLAYLALVRSTQQGKYSPRGKYSPGGRCSPRSKHTRVRPTISISEEYLLHTWVEADHFHLGGQLVHAAAPARPHHAPRILDHSTSSQFRVHRHLI